MRVTNDKVLFWGSIFSQWSTKTDNGSFQFEENGLKFVTAEQYMMYQKAMLFNDIDIANKILSTKNPKEQKSLGRQVKNFSEEIWQANCDEIVFKGNLLKFTQNPSLKAEMLSFKGKKFVEASPVDFIWGIGLHFDNDLALDEKNWKGSNKLGKALDRVLLFLIQQEFEQNISSDPNVRPDMVICPGEMQLNIAFEEAKKNPTNLSIDIDEKSVIDYIDNIIRSKKR